MKLATLKDGSRDGQLAVVARDLKTAQLADGIAPTLQAALDDWAFIAPQLEALSAQLNSGRAARSFGFEPANCMAPLPRAFERAGARAYPQRRELARQAGLHAAPAGAGPELYHSGADLLGPLDEIVLAHAEWGIDCEAGLAVLCGDLAAGATPDQADAQIRLLMLVNEVTLHNLQQAELAGGAAPLQSKPATACAPVALTPDELGEAWKGGKAQLTLRASRNGELVGQVKTGLDMAFNFPQLLAHLARTRALRAGAMVGAGAPANKDARRGYASIADQRCREIIAGGAAVTPFLQFGDSVKFELAGADGKPLFGAIEQRVRQAEARRTR